MYLPFIIYLWGGAFGIREDFLSVTKKKKLWGLPTQVKIRLNQFNMLAEGSLTYFWYLSSKIQLKIC